MKKIILTLVALLIPIVINAESIQLEIDNIYYYLDTTNKTAYVKKGPNTIGNVTIRAMITYKNNNYSVTAIDRSAFSGCSSLTSISIPDGVTSIGYEAFNQCIQLQTVSISNSSKLNSIGLRAFEYCSSLESINIPDGVTSINAQSFHKCSQLQSVSISNSSKLESIGGEAFKGCSSLTSINIPDGVTNIGSSAFNGCNELQTASISNSSKLNSIGLWAFQDCSNLTSINIPDGVTSIGDYAFYGCSELQTVSISNSSKLESIGSFTFYNCSSLETINIPDGVTNIGVVAFYGCSSLTSINIPDGVTSIGGSAFDKCVQLQTVGISKSSKLESIGGSAFYNCSSLESINIPNGVTSIGSSTFYNCSSLASINIPDGVTNIYDYTFENCSQLQTASISNSSKLESIGGQAFKNCSNLTSINIPDGVTSIGIEAFYNCSSLASINIPDGVTSINRYVFSGCSQLQTARISNSSKLESIDNSAFSGCSSLESINIPDDVTSIGEYAFAACSQLQTVSISKSSKLTSIGDYAFENCSSLTSFLIPAKLEIVGFVAFNNCINIKELSFYCKNIGNWFSTSRGMLEEILIGNSVETIKADAFYRSTSLNTLTFEDDSSLKEIGDKAFYGCDALKLIDFPEPLETIGSSAFYSCDALETIKLPKTLKMINLNAFNYCNAVKDVYAYMPKPFGIDASVFSTTTYNNAVLRVDGVADKYRKRFAWSKFFHIINIGEIPGEGDGGIDSENSGSSDGQYTTQNYYYDLTAQGNGEIVVDEYITQMDLGMGASWTQYFEGLTVRDEQKVIEIPHFPGTGVPFKFIPDKGNVLKQVLFTSENNGTPQDVTSDLVYDSSISGYTYQAVDHDSYPKLVAIFEEGTPVPSDAVTLTAKNYSRVYGESNPAFEFTVSNGTITSGTPTISCSATTTSPVGTYPITINKGSVTNSSVTCVNGTLTITKASLTIKAGNYTKEEGEANPTFTLTYEGFKNNETQAVLTKQPTVSCSAQTDSPAGNYDVIVSGAEAQNYDISYVNGTLTVTEKEDISGLVNGDVFTAQTEEGVTMLFRVISITDKTCQVGVGNQAAIDRNTTGGITIPSKVKGLRVTRISSSSFINCPNLTSLVIPEGVETLESNSIWKCNSITSFVLPASVTCLSNTFGGVSKNLHSLSVAPGNPIYDSRGNCNAIIESTTNTLVYGCAKTVIPNTITAIGAWSFSGGELESIDIPNKVVTIGEFAFKDNNFKEITIPASVSEIGWSAFANCNKLEKVTILSKDCKIGSGAFSKNSSLKEVISYINKPQTANSAIFYTEVVDGKEIVNDNVKLYVPNGTKSLYENTEGWKEFKNIIEMRPFVLGDANNDGDVNEKDRNYIVRHIMGDTPDDFDEEAANLNGDDKIDVADIVELNNLLAPKD